MSSIDQQVGGDHYRQGKIQPIEYIEANNLGFLEGCVIKRATRHNRPGGKGRQDIEKAIHELQLLLELRYAAPEGAVDITALDDVGKWYAWTPGCGAPLPSPETLVRVRLRDGESPSKAWRVSDWDWAECGDATITAYQIVDDGHSATPAPNVTERDWVSAAELQPERGRRVHIRTARGVLYQIEAQVDLVPEAHWRYAD